MTLKESLTEFGRQTVFARFPVLFGAMVGWVFLSFIGLPAFGQFQAADNVSSVGKNEQGIRAPEKPPVAIDDARMNSKLIAGIQRLKKANKVVKTETLLKQLSRKKTNLSVPLATYGKPSDNVSLFKQCRESVLMLGQNYKCGYCPRWHANVASGFVISEDGLAVTNYHVVESWGKKKAKPKRSKNQKENEEPKGSGNRKQKFEVPKGLGSVAAMTYDGKVFPIVEVLAANKEDDLAIIRLDAKGLKPLPISYRSEVGQKVVTISHPKNQYFSMTTGTVTRHYVERRPRQRPVNRMSVSTDYAGGSSGGPIINDCGEVVGVVIYTREIFSDQMHKRGLQMVLKGCAPASSIMKLLGK